MNYKIEYCNGLMRLRDHLEEHGIESHMPDNMGWEQPGNEVRSVIGKMMEPFRFVLSSQYFTVFGEETRRHFFSRNPRFNMLWHRDSITYLGFEIGLHVVSADEQGIEDDGPLPLADIIQLSCDGQVWEGGFIGPCMDDDKITSVFNAFLTDTHGWNFGRMGVTYSDDILNTALLQGIKLPEEIDGTGVEFGEHILFDLYLGFLKPYNLEGQWVEISDGFNRRRVKFSRSKMLRQIVRRSREVRGPIRTYMAEVDLAVEAGALEPQSKFGIFEIGRERGILVSPYWPDWAVEAQYQKAVKKSVECVIGED